MHKHPQPTQNLQLPPQVSLTALLGAGKRAIVYHARIGQLPCVLKIYRTRYVEKYRSRYGLEISNFELERNQRFYADPVLRRYCVQPLAAFGEREGYVSCFAQEYAEGPLLRDFAKQHQGSMPQMLAAGLAIVERARTLGLHDLDLNADNILVRRVAGGWAPVLYDFNLVPQSMYPPNPLVAFYYAAGIRKPWHRDLRALDTWGALAGQGNSDFSAQNCLTAQDYGKLPAGR